MWVSCTNNNARASLALIITNVKFPLTYQTQKVTSNTYATVSKQKPIPQYPQIMKEWMEEGVDISMRPKDIVNGMNCKLVPIKVRSITWRVLNHAYLSGTHCSESYPYKECSVCDEKRAGVDHRYFGCKTSTKFWTKVQWELFGRQSRTSPPGKDMMFEHTMKGAPLPLQALHYQLAIHQVHSTRRSCLIGQKTINVKEMVGRWKHSVSDVLERINKFGKLIPGKYQTRSATIANSEYIEYDPILKHIQPCWRTPRSLQDLHNLA
ncbi:hypothetical protein DSO57_1038948 [Entomophthora muscae]|uniref:Uncharacterized protein n=1 Tax=Entomophthora muscae TaxID=34485 RepID=A0ACC2T9K3_9FUNG|nr:hypothetical protein DSO57_1038948 [Entomophthora muscae]